jgi:hypothetical protein
VVVTLLAIFLAWLGWQRHLIRQRKEMLGYVHAELSKAGIMFPAPILRGGFSGLSAWRKWLGDVPEVAIAVPWPKSDPRWTEVQRLYPEAEIFTLEPLRPGPETIDFGDFN